MRVKGIRTYDDLLDSHGEGDGCEICKPAVASILASTWNEPITEQATIQDTNDKYLANIQRGGTYSVVPRIAGGEITPEKLMAIGRIAKKYDLYTKITGGQRIDMFGARVDQLPDIWEELIKEGFARQQPASPTRSTGTGSTTGRRSRWSCSTRFRQNSAGEGEASDRWRREKGEDARAAASVSEWTGFSSETVGAALCRD